MDQLSLRHLQEAMGIYLPWEIESIQINGESKDFHVHLSTGDGKRFQGFFTAQNEKKSVRLVDGKWRYMNIAGFSTVIHAQVPQSTSLGYGCITDEASRLPAFLGPADRRYSNYVRQNVAVSQALGMNLSHVGSILRLGGTCLQEVLRDVEKIPDDSRSLALLPVDTDKVWELLLRDKLALKSKSLPLKYLLSKLRLASVRISAPENLLPYTRELRNFFINQAGNLGEEIAQLCGIQSGSTSKINSARKIQRLVLPSGKHPIWQELLSGRFNLHSTSVPLNLFLAQQRAVYSLNPERRPQIVDLVRNYFRQKHRGLRSELIRLNSALNEFRKKNVLPGPEHGVWRNILESNNFIPTDNMAFKLLLAQLRVQQSHDRSQEYQIEAAQKIRKFMTLNQQALRSELGQLFHKCRAM